METTERLCNAQWGEEPLVESDNGAVRRGSRSALQRAAPALSAHLPKRTSPARRWGGGRGLPRQRAPRHHPCSDTCLTFRRNSGGFRTALLSRTPHAWR